MSFTFRLKEIFTETPFISKEGTKQLAEEMGLAPAFIDTWFKNHRQKDSKGGRGLEQAQHPLTLFKSNPHPQSSVDTNL